MSVGEPTCSDECLAVVNILVPFEQTWIGNRSFYILASPFPLPVYPALSVLQRVPGDHVHGLILHLVASTSTFQRGLESTIGSPYANSTIPMTFLCTMVIPTTGGRGSYSFFVQLLAG